ncbi:MAG: hypothetical protein AAF449_10480 [Myxococcota bacterium]
MANCRQRAGQLAVLWISMAMGIGCAGEDRTPGSCASQRDCTNDEVCLAGLCTSIQSEDPCTPGSCGAGEFCDPADRRCRPSVDAGSMSDAGLADAGSTDASPVDASSFCSIDRECGRPPVDICVAARCVKGCAEPGGIVCADNTICDPTSGRCIEDNACQNDFDCGPPQRICTDDRCVAGCGANPQLCTSGEEVCDTSTGRCVELPGRCTLDEACEPPMTVCQNRQCVPGCGQPGGIQCVGIGASCVAETGRCSGTQGCAFDSDCMNADLICAATRCVLRCDRGGTCGANEVCNPNDGRCLPTDVPLGAPCTIDGQCEDSVCIGVTSNMNPVRVCARPCGATSECPLDFSCREANEMQFCLSEDLNTPPAAYDVRSGGFCDSTTRSCQSRFCSVDANICLELCSRDADCSALGGGCWLFRNSDETTFSGLCLSVSGFQAGASCTANAACESNFCQQGRCAGLCCRDQDCGLEENCVPSELPNANLVKTCVPRPPTAGSGALGSICTTNDQCETELCAPHRADDPTGPRQCSSPCCRHDDCDFLGPEARCRPTLGPVNNTQVGVCFRR